MTLLLCLLVFLVLIVVGVVSKEKTFTRKLAVAVDMLAATLLWSAYDITISSRAGIAVRLKTAKQPYSKLLVMLAYVLNKIDANHVELAIQADIMRGTSALLYLRIAEAAGTSPAPATK